MDFTPEKWEKQSIFDVLLTVGLLLMGTAETFDTVAALLAAEYELTTLGPVKCLLGVEILLIDTTARGLYSTAVCKDIIEMFS